MATGMHQWLTSQLLCNDINRERRFINWLGNNLTFFVAGSGNLC